MRKQVSKRHPKQLPYEVIERIAASVAEGLAFSSPSDLEGLFLLMSEVAKNCNRDWPHVENVANILTRHLLIFTPEFDEAERQADARIRAKKGGAR